MVLASSIRRAERRRTDPEYRARVNAQYRACYHNTIKKRPDYLIKRYAYLNKRNSSPDMKVKLKAYAQRYREKYRIRRLVTSIIFRCKRSGMPYDPVFLKTFNDLRPEQCPCCKVKLNYALNLKGGLPPISGPSFDRIDTTKGYVAGNVAIICWRCNALKRDAMLYELEAIVAYMREHLCK